MGTLIDQFCDAADQWARIVGDTGETIVVTWTMSYTGGVDTQDPQGGIDPETLPESLRSRISAGAVRGQYTAAQMRGQLELLVHTTMVFEEFLVIALIRRLEEDFEDWSENYVRGLEKLREDQRRMEAQAADPVQLQDLIDRVNRLSRERGGDSDFTAQSFQTIIDRTGRWGQFSADEQRKRRLYLDAWRQVTAPILARENRERFKWEGIE